jgi:hypothetical protein
MRCLDAGITVARTADDLVRYPGKFMIVDGRLLYVLSFNFTHLDIDRSRRFGDSYIEFSLDPGSFPVVSGRLCAQDVQSGFPDLLR